MKKNIGSLLLISTFTLWPLSALHGQKEKGQRMAGLKTDNETRELEEESGNIFYEGLKKQRKDFKEKRKSTKADREMISRQAFIKNVRSGGGPQLLKMGTWGNLSEKSESLSKRQESITNFLETLKGTTKKKDAKTGEEKEVTIYQLDQKTRDEVEKFAKETEEILKTLESNTSAKELARKALGAEKEAVQKTLQQLKEILAQGDVREMPTKEEVKEKEKQIENKEAEVKELRKELNQLIKKFQAPIKEADKKIEALKKDIENLKQNAPEFKEQKEALEKKIEEAQAERKTAVIQMNENEKIKEILDKEAEIKELKADIEFAKAPEGLAEALESYKKLASASEWSQKRKVLSVLGLIAVAGVGSLIFTMAGGVGTDIDIGEQPGVFFDEGTREVDMDRFGDVADVEDQFAQQGGYVQMGAFGGAQIGAVGEVTPLENTGPREPTAEEIAQEQVDNINQTEAYGRLLNEGEQKELLDLFIRKHQRTKALAQLTETTGVLSKSEKIKAAERREEIRKIMFDIYMKELNIRYNHDNGSLVRLKEYSESIKLLDNELKELAPQLQDLEEKQKILTNALTDNKYDKDMQEKIKYGVEKLTQQINQTTGIMRNIANEKKYLQLNEKIYKGELTDQAMYEQLSADPSFMRNTSESYESSRIRRLVSDHLRNINNFEEEK